jgi:hypothetical protein
MRTLSFALLFLLAACATGGGGSGGGGSAANAGAPAEPAHEKAKAAEPEVSGASPAPSAPAGAAGSGTVLVAQTSEERRAAINKQLDDSLGSFDERLRKEQQQVAQERDARHTPVTGTAAAEGTDKGAGVPAGTAATEAGVLAPYGNHHSKGRDHSGDLKSDKTGKVADDNAGNGAVAREVPDGSDDDVVARRLRQAAQQETDPELKEKLWQEYTDYKKNAQGK